MTNEERAKRLAERIKQEAIRSAGKGAKAATIFLYSRVKETLNVRAPRKLVHGVRGDHYVATTPATPGAPMRRVSGDAQRSLFWNGVGPNTYVIGITAKSPSGFSYPKYHELQEEESPGSGQHQSIVPTVKRYQKELANIASVPVVLEGV